MMANESTQKKLSRVRPPRVQITYDVEIGDAIETKELPFVMGVLGDYAGHSKEPLPKLKERKFVQIDRDNFDEVLKGMAPRLAMKVDNKLVDDESQLGIELNFQNLADFEPQNVARQVEPLNKLLAARQRLADLRNKMAGNDKLEELLDDVVRDTEKLRQISKGKNDKVGE
ncbi:MULTISPECIES: type VI secretion system contractile sheath small subunit [Aquitalea]|uniref:type VI secretion system contractile sheath small subunit n=1 Tax=Aquitalea TaxID=407217 RepID=UPI001F22AD30|nr:MULTISPECIES: type VI secretion system contractile sheath small subunit [Aquitalea]